MGRAAFAAAILAGLWIAVPARAATIAVNGPCFVVGDSITASGGGFSPGAAVSYSFDGVGSGSGAADGAGNVSTQLFAPPIDANAVVHTFNLTATDQNNLANVASVPVTVTKLTATIDPQRAKPARKVRFSIRGLQPGRQVYLHYVLHRRARATVALGKPSPPCGSLVVRRRFFPMATPSVGTWYFQFDESRRYSSATRPAVRGKVLLYRAFTSTSARASILR